MKTDPISILVPGGLRFGDHWRMGLPEALLVAVSLSMLLWLLWVLPL